MTEHDDARIVDWLARGEGRGREEALEAVLGEVRTTRQRPAWAVSLTGGTFAEPRGVFALRRGILVMGAVVLVAALIVGGLVAGGTLPLRLSPQPAPSVAAIVPNRSAGPSDRPDASPSPAPTSAPTTGHIAYSVVDCPAGKIIPRCSTHLWLAAADGRDAHVIQGTGVIGWSADGSRLVLESVHDVGGGVSLLIADPTGAVVKTVEVPCTSPMIDDKYGGHLCPDEGEFALSPDGRRVALTRTDPNVDNSSVLSILDLDTGQIRELAATRTTNPADEFCNTSNRVRACQGFDGSPRWSPDGRTIAFERQLMAPEPGAAWDSAAVFVVDADGSNYARVTPPSVHAIAPSWSPDGTRLAFVGSDMVVNAAGTSVVEFTDDVYAIGVDGSGLARLTEDGISGLPDWTSGGRLAFIRNAASTSGEHWIMDADGRNQTRLGDSLADLSAAGCTTCIYVDHEPIRGPLPRAYWQPRP
jgi:dipeptidyl aminopeptidase/acylaminoacyl peptidase